MKKKYTLFLLAVLVGVLAVFCMQTVLGVARERRTKAITAEFGAALLQLQQTPPGVQRVETFVARLKGIETASAPVEVKQALQNYVSAVQQSVAAARVGRDIKPFDPAIAQAKQRLIDSVQEYD